MHHFAAEMAQVELGSVATFVRRAEAIYDENLNAYVKLVLRRSFAKLIVGLIYSHYEQILNHPSARIILTASTACSAPPRRPKSRTTTLTPSHRSRRSLRSTIARTCASTSIRSSGGLRSTLPKPPRRRSTRRSGLSPPEACSSACGARARLNCCGLRRHSATGSRSAMAIRESRSSTTRRISRQRSRGTV